jgi:hypothetical protein
VSAEVEEVRDFEEGTCDGGGERGLTVHGFALFLVDAVILRDEEVEVMVRTGDGANLVFVGDEVAGAGSAVRPWLVVENKANAYPRPFRSAGNSGSLGSVLLRRWNIVDTCIRVFVVV